jgi:hypothetical protein
VGNGVSIQIWSDKWLPFPAAGVPVTPFNTLPEDACVSQLIQATTGTWDNAMVDRVFLPGEASLIKSMVLSYRAPEDLLVWCGKRSGRYSVRSAYRMLVAAESDGQPGCLPMGGWQNFWKCIWSVQAPSKIRVFLWRVCNNALPTLVNLLRCTIISSAMCSFYSGDDEDLLHVLWTCPRITSVWAHHSLARKLI